MKTLKETACDWYGGEEMAAMCSSEFIWIKRLTALAEQYPDDVKIRKMPEDNGGVILVDIPKKWIKIKPPVKRTDKQREVARERMKRMNNNKLKNNATVGKEGANK